MATGIDDPAIASVALEQGAFGYIVKPFAPNELLINAANALLRRRLESEARQQREHLEQVVEERTHELQGALSDLRRSAGELRLSRHETIRRLARAVEYRDLETGGHIERMSNYCGVLARRLGFPDERAELIRMASPLHDVGKIAIPDTVLLKPGKFTDAERAEMQKHAELGFRILAGSPTPLLETAATIARTHHEKVDGSGYPRGLFGDAIPIEGRIAAVADVFDALTTDRVYRPAFSVDEGLEIMAEGRGTHFDPQVLDAFTNSIGEFLEVKDRYEQVTGTSPGL
jgi:putative two-component system response regulator